MALKDDRHQLYMDAIKRKVCSVCLDRHDDGSCGLTHRTCAIEGHLPQIVDAITRIESGRMDEYIAAIEAQVCSRCENKAGLECRLQQSGECALDTYLYLVVEAIEEVDANAGPRS
ncbi:MAG TPA: hypothetical protein VMV21_17880 [Vicinamibacteria bacterium]|nr:hypothetical protein [Vicinamibacteria bacterium]